MRQISEEPLVNDTSKENLADGNYEAPYDQLQGDYERPVSVTSADQEEPVAYAMYIGTGTR